MLSSFRAMKFALAILAAVMLAGVPAVAHAATGSVRIVITRLGFVASAHITTNGEIDGVAPTMRGSR